MSHICRRGCRCGRCYFSCFSCCADLLVLILHYHLRGGLSWAYLFHPTCATCSSVLGSCCQKCLLYHHGVGVPAHPSDSVSLSALSFLAFTFWLLKLQSCLNLQGGAKDWTRPFRQHDLSFYYKLNLEVMKRDSFDHVPRFHRPYRLSSIAFYFHWAT